MELLGVADIAEGDLIEGVFYMVKGVLSVPFFMLVCMAFAKVGTTPLTAYSASLTQGLISVQKKLVFLMEKLARVRRNINAKLVILTTKLRHSFNTEGVLWKDLGKERSKC